MEQGPDILSCRNRNHGSVASKRRATLCMGDEAALGRAGGAGGVDDVGEMVRLGDRGDVVRAVSREARGFPVEANDGPIEMGEASGEAGVGEHGFRAGILEHEGRGGLPGRRGRAGGKRRPP